MFDCKNQELYKIKLWALYFHSLFYILVFFVILSTLNFILSISAFFMFNLDISMGKKMLNFLSIWKIC